MKYEAIIFDWDGTLVDSAGRIVESMQLAANDLSLDFRTDFEIKQIIGLGLPEAICTLWPEIEGRHTDIQEMRQQYNYHFVADVRPTVEFFDYATHLLDKLSASGKDLAVATGKSRSGLDRAFRELKIGHMFRDSRCADETKSKPHPLMLEELSVSLGVSPDAMLMVGDTEFDLKMANAAGIDSVAITHGAHSRDKLEACNPAEIVDDLKQLHEWIERV
jgi:phosphoglycolate phosphatase